MRLQKVRGAAGLAPPRRGAHSSPQELSGRAGTSLAVRGDALVNGHLLAVQATVAMDTMQGVGVATLATRSQAA